MLCSPVSRTVLLFSVFLAAANSLVSGRRARVGEADRMRRDRRERPRRGGRELDNRATRKTTPCGTGLLAE
jgi:hypothetical protein